MASLPDTDTYLCAGDESRLMLFKDRHVPMIRRGEKTATRRESKPNVTPGGIYMAAAPSMVPEGSNRTAMYLRHNECDCYIRVLEVYQQPLGRMGEHDYRKEGGYTPEEFRSIWREINDEWDPEQVVWVVAFEYVRHLSVKSRIDLHRQEDGPPVTFDAETPRVAV